MSNGLRNLKVLDLSTGVAGAMAAKMMADLGATVVKVEPPEGDPLRRRGPFPPGGAHPEASGAFAYLHTSKRSITLPLGTPEGHARLAELAARCDVLVHDTHPAQMAARGLDYATLSAGNPALVMVSITPFGLHGPNSHFQGDDLTLTHAGGWGWLCPGKSTPAHLPPIKPSGPHALAQAGLHAAVAAMVAAHGARASGVGEHVDFSIQEAVIFILGRHFAHYPYTGRADSRKSPVPYEPMSFYPTRDGHVFIICPEQAQWERLVELLGAPDWAQDARFQTRDGRKDHAADLWQLLAGWTREHSMEEIFLACQKERVGAAPVFTHAGLEADPHLAARSFWVETEHPHLGRLRLPGAPYTLKHPWWGVHHPPPTLGEANGQEDDLLPPMVAPKNLPPGAAPKNLPPRVETPSPTPPPEPPPPPLQGIRVLDLSWVWAGPHCTMMLGMMGAEVIKVETSSRLDLTRRAHLFADDKPGSNRCGYFNQINQCKKSAAINLGTAEGRELVYQLARDSHVMISNFGTGVVERLKVGPEDIHAINPAMIIALISAFGQTGPNRLFTGYGPLIAPLAGVSCQTGYEDGEPRDVGLAYGDPNGGVYTAIAIAAALLARQEAEARGEPFTGQVIDLSMWEAMIGTAFEGWMAHALGNPPQPNMANHDAFAAPHNVYRCTGEDAWVAISATEDAAFAALCTVMGQPALAQDPRNATAQSRKANEAALDAAIGAWCAPRDPWAITHALQAAGVAAYPSVDSRALAHDPHLKARGFYTYYPHAEVGTRQLAGAPWQLTRRESPPGSAAPLLGEHTDWVLRERLGLDDDRIAELRELGAIE